jgi:hypothetical protein
MIKRNPAGIKIDWVQVEEIVEKIIDFVTHLRSHIIEEIDKKQASTTSRYIIRDCEKVKSEMTVGAVNAMSMRQALLSVKFPLESGRVLAAPQFNHVMVSTGIIVPLTIRTKRRVFTVNTEIFLYPKKRKRASRGYMYTDERNLFSAGAGAWSPIREKPLREYLKGETLLTSKISINVSSEIKYKKAVDDINYYAKTTRENLRDCVVHEITHIADPLVAFDNEEGSASHVKRGDWNAYYNTPTEVRARINEFISRVRVEPQSFDTFDDFCAKIVYPDPAWAELNAKNRRMLLSALYSEWIKIKESGPPKLSEFQRRKQQEKSLLIFRYFGAALGGIYRQPIAVSEPKVKVIVKQVEDKPQEKKEKIQGRGRKKYEPKRMWVANYRASKALFSTSTLYGIVKQEILRRGLPLSKYENEFRSPYNDEGGIDWDGDFKIPPELTQEAAWIRYMDEKLDCPVGWQTEVAVNNYYYGNVLDINITRVA